MSSLFDQLSALQKIPRAYEEWAEYRAALTDFITNHTGRHADALIVGAGGCNDFALPQLSKHFSSLTLLDRDGQAIAEGCCRQGVQSGGISTVQADLLGISDAAYRAMDSALLEEIRRQQRDVCAPERFEQLFLEQMQTVFRGRAPDDLIAMGLHVDYVICCGVHSQLLNMFARMAGVYRRYIPFDSARILRKIHDMNGSVVRELNAQLWSLARAGVVLGLETGRVGASTGIEGASQALMELQPYAASICRKTHLRWPFDAAQGKIYDVTVMVLARGAGV